MSYILAKDFRKSGCLVVETEGGKAVAGLVTYLSIRKLDKGIQILTVSNPDVFGEYGPYTFVDTEKEFIDRVLDM